MNRNLADGLRKLRLEAKMSQDFVAKKIGVSLSTYSRFERNEGEIDLNTAIKIADLYKITVDELLHASDPSFKIEEVKGIYQKRWTVPVIVALDGTSETLEMWITKLTSINGAI